jgi:cell division septation protein DedD
MSPTECATDTSPLAPEVEPVHARPDHGSRLLKRLLIGFATTVTVALTLAGWYVSGRIVASDETHFSAPATPVAPVAAPQAVPVSVIAVDPAPQVVATPPAPELYLQVATLGAKQDAKYIRQLEAKGFHAKVDFDSKEEVSRILIGPYSQRAALEKAQRKLATTGILAMESAY